MKEQPPPDVSAEFRALRTRGFRATRWMIPLFLSAMGAVCLMGYEQWRAVILVYIFAVIATVGVGFWVYACRCPNCRIILGKHVDYTANLVRCPSCSAILEDKSIPLYPSRECKQCGSSFVSGREECHRCGWKWDEA